MAVALRAVAIGWLLMPAAAAVAQSEIRLPRPAAHEPITVRADAVSEWTEGDYRVRHLQGQVAITQGATVARADDAVVWVQPSRSLGEPTKLIAYLEGAGGRPIVLEWRGGEPTDQPAGQQQAPNWFGRFATTSAVQWRTPPATPPPPAERPAIYERGFAQLRGERAPPIASLQPPQTIVDPAVAPAQFQFQPPIVAPPGPAVPGAGGFRRVRINPRSDVGATAEYRTQEGVAVITGGVNVVVEGIRVDGLPPSFGPVDMIDLETDRAVIWTAPGGIGTSFEQQNETPLEIYMEGNIVFRQGDRTVYADRMYYDVRRNVGVVLNAELLTPLPEDFANRRGRQSFRGLVRLKAGVLRQLDESRFVASDALVTTSRLEEPTYHLGAETIEFEDRQTPVVDPTTGIVSFQSERTARSRQNRVHFGGVPLLFWPTIVTDLDEPVFYLNDLRIRNDSIFGTQVLVDLDVYEIFGLERVDGTKWDLSLDYLSDRGFGFGTEFEYQRDVFGPLNGPAAGRVDAWFIDDTGLDNLGFGRRDIIPEENFRGRAFWNHRQRVTDGLLRDWIVQAEVGWISDRTFLEQFYESEWDGNKDQTTGVRLRRIRENRSLVLGANGQLNDFFTQTQWLPRLDHYLLGQELLADRLTWFAHTSAGYANLNVATAPEGTNPSLLADFDLFPWETDDGGVAPIDGEGERFVTRHEIDAPVALGPVKVVPFALGEVGHWGSDINGEDLQRAYLHTGARASIPFWAVNPAVRDPLFNLNGLAHKVVFDAEVSYTDANEDFDDLPLFDQIDDDAIEEIRRDLFEPAFPVEFDPRFYAIRTGIQGVVTSPSFELVDDQAAVRLGMRHRLQTKRGAPGRQRIVDWLIFDANATIFPDAGRDNFGEDVGLIDYDAQWFVGDRFTIVSDGFADVFDDGLRTISGGVRLNRPERGNVFLGYRTIRGPFSADLITATVNYRLGPKWIASGSTVIDFSEAGNIGQSFTLSRIGESIVVSVGANVDESKNNVGFNFLIEPRIFPRISPTRRTGITIAPAGLEYLE